jgi:hypothetical protein
LGEPMIARVRRRIPVTALSPDAVRRDCPAVGRLLVSSRHACSVVRLSRATTRAPGSSWYSHPAAVATSCQDRVTGPVLVDLDRREPGGAYHGGEVALAGAALEDPGPRPPDGALDPSKGSAVGRPGVLQEGVPPAGPQDRPDFADDLPGIGNRAQQKAGDDGICRLVIEVDCIGGCAADLDVDAAVGRAPLKCAVHVRGWAR